MNEIEDYLSEKQRLLVRMRKLLCYTASVMKIEENPDEICQNSMEAESASHAAVPAVSLQHRVRWTMCERVSMTKMRMRIRIYDQ